MKSIVIRYRARAILKFRKYANWSVLSYIGKNPISRLIIFAPIVAQILIHKPEVQFIEYLDLQMLNWAYWSLISFAAGQLIYTFICPDDIKEYPNRHEFISSLNNTETDDRLREDAFHIIRKSFHNYCGSLKLKEDDLISFSRDQALANMKSQRSLSGDQEDIDKRVFDHFQRFAKSIDTGQFLYIDWVLLENNLEILTKYISTEKPEIEWAHHHNLRHDIDKYATSTHWRVNLLDLRYMQDNLSRPALRGVCISLYAFGMSYFLYTGLSNMWRVVLTYITSNNVA